MAKSAFNFVLFVCAAFVVLTLGAMLAYPGGTALDAHSRGYEFSFNFFSDLGRTNARNNTPNPIASKLFFFALSSAGVALGVFFLSFARFFWGDLAQRVVTGFGVVFGLLSACYFVGIALNPTNLRPHQHVHFVYSAFRAFPLAVLCFSLAMLLSRSYPRRGLWVFGAFTVILVAYLALITAGPPTDSALGLMIQSLGQKAVVYASLACVAAQSWLARKHLSAEVENNERDVRLPPVE